MTDNKDFPQPPHSDFDEDERERPFGPSGQETFTAEEYAKAIDNLRKFAGRSISEIRSLDDLNFEMQFVARALHIAVLSSGTWEETEFEYDHPARGNVKAAAGGYVIRQPVSDGRIFVSADKGVGHIVHETDLDKDRVRTNYYAWFPVNVPISDRGVVKVTDGNADAVDYRNSSGLPSIIKPGKEPDNPEVQQDYARVIQDGVKAVLEVARPPTQLPAEITQS